MAEKSTSTLAKTTANNEVDLDNQQIYNETEAVMNQRVAKSTRENYERSIITFIPWLYYHHNKHPSIIQPTLYNMMRT